MRLSPITSIMDAGYSRKIMTSAVSFAWEIPGNCISTEKHSTISLIKMTFGHKKGWKTFPYLRIKARGSLYRLLVFTSLQPRCPLCVTFVSLWVTFGLFSVRGWGKTVIGRSLKFRLHEQAKGKTQRRRLWRLGSVHWLFPETVDDYDTHDNKTNRQIPNGR